MRTSKGLNNGMILGAILGIAAIIAGILIMPVNDRLLPAIIANLAIYLLFGAAAGFMRTDGGWRAGIWVAAPFCFLTALSMLFAGIYTPRIFTRDIPILITIISAACLGGYVGSQAGKRLKPLI